MTAGVAGPREGGASRAKAVPSAVRAGALAAVVAAATLAGCASTYSSFAPETDIPACARWLDEARGIPSAVHRVEAGIAAGIPFHVQVEERGTGDRPRLVVLVHGALADRRLWRYMVGSLGAAYDLLLVDLPGCGGSDRPAPEAMGPDGYAPDALARAVLRAVRARIAARPVRPALTLVAHSLGGSAVLRALGSGALRSEFADVLDRVDGAVLLAPVEFSYTKRDPDFGPIVELTGLEVALGNLTGILREEIARAGRDGVEDPAALPREEVDRMWEILTDPERRAAAQAMIRTAIPFTSDGLPDWPRVEALEADYARVHVPCLVVCGDRDDAIPPALAFKVRQQLPRAWLRVLPRSGHSLPTERPEECSRLVQGFIESRGEGWAAYEQVTPGSSRDPAVAGMETKFQR